MTASRMHLSASKDSDVIDGAALQLLEILESLSEVYESAEYFAEVVLDNSVSEHTLIRCLYATGCSTGAIYLTSRHGFELQAEQDGAAALLKPAAPQLPSKGALFRNGAAAKPYLAEAAHGRSLLCAPIMAGDRKLGVVAILGEPGKAFTTKEAKLIAAVTSQAAIALRSAKKYRAVAVERSRLRSVIENTPDGIIVLNPSGQTVLCNSVARSMFGIPQDAAEGTDFPTTLSDWDVSHHLGLFERESDTFEISRGSGADEKVLVVRYGTFRGTDGTVANFILTVSDLTEKRREDHVKKDILLRLSHELRTSLGGIHSTLRQLRGDELADRAATLDEVSSRADELTRLVDRLLQTVGIVDESWTAGGESDMRELRATIHEQLLERHADASFTLEWDVADDARYVGVPSSQLRLVLDNLIDNLIDHAITAPTSDQPWVRVTSERRGDRVVVRAEDRGPGIAPELREQIGEASQQFDTEPAGHQRDASDVGIGLPLVVEIVRRAGGTVEVTDAQPHGTVFSLSFPAAEPSTEVGP